MSNNKLKESLVNPLMTIEVIIGAQLPDSRTPYLSSLYDTFNDIFNEIYHTNETINMIDSILNKNKITEDLLDRVNNDTKYRTSLSIQLMSAIRNDLQKAQISICKSRIINNVEIEKFVTNFRRLLINMSLNELFISNEIRSNLLFAQDNTITPLVEWVIESFERTVNIIINAMKYNDGGCDMSKSKFSNSFVTEWYEDDTGIRFETVKKDRIKINDTKDKRDKNELIENVNRIDKSSGVNLKNPRETIDDDADYEDRIGEYRYILSKILLVLNDIKESRYISYDNIFGFGVKNIKINKKFKDISIWFNGIDSDLDCNTFKARFLTYLISWVIKNLTKIADKCYILNDDGEFIEYDAKIAYIEHTIERLCVLTNNMLTGKNYEDDLLYFSEIQMYIKTRKKHLKKSLRKIDNIHTQSDILSVNLKSFLSSDDVSMDTLLKLSYLVTTHDYTSKFIVEFNPGFSFKDKEDAKIMIIQLGESIIDANKIYGTTDMFEYFIKSDPLIYSKYHDAQIDSRLVVGILAIKYFAFVINSKAIKKRVDKII